MGYEPVTNCRVCGDDFDVYHAPDDRVCETCKENEMELSDEERELILSRRAATAESTEKAVPIPMDAAGLKINVGRDGTWLHFLSSAGVAASLNVENLAQSKGGITERALAAWAADRREQAKAIAA